VFLILALSFVVLSYQALDIFQSRSHTTCSQEVQAPVKSADNSSTTDGTLILNFFWTAYKILRPGPTKFWQRAARCSRFSASKATLPFGVFSDHESYIHYLHAQQMTSRWRLGSHFQTTNMFTGSLSLTSNSKYSPTALGVLDMRQAE